jgi:hypothetical protein
VGLVSEGPGLSGAGDLPLHVRQLLGIAHGVEPGDEAVVDVHRDEGVDLAVEPKNQRRWPLTCASCSGAAIRLAAAERFAVGARRGVEPTAGNWQARIP